jgi:hypothetical protein
MKVCKTSPPLPIKSVLRLYFTGESKKSLKLNIKHSNYEPIGHKNNAYGLFYLLSSPIPKVA